MMKTASVLFLSYLSRYHPFIAFHPNAVQKAWLPL